MPPEFFLADIIIPEPREESRPEKNKESVKQPEQALPGRSDIPSTSEEEFKTIKDPGDKTNAAADVPNDPAQKAGVLEEVSAPMPQKDPQDSHQANNSSGVTLYGGIIAIAAAAIVFVVLKWRRPGLGDETTNSKNQ